MKRVNLTTLYYVQNCAIGVTLLGLIFASFRKVADRRQASHAIFFWTMPFILLNLLLEPIFGALSGRAGFAAGLGVRAVASLYFILQPVPEALWIAYLFSLASAEGRPSGRQWLWLSLPFALNLIFTLMSLTGDFTFFIGPDNAYHRGRYYLLVPALGYSYLIFYVYYAFRKRKQMLRHEFRTVLGSWLPTMIACVVQTLFRGVYAIWLAACFSMLILYIDIMIRQANTDSLTGLANRRRFDGELEAAFHAEGRKMLTAGIMIDVDNFKEINDSHGHLTGDRVLEAVGGILQKSARKGDLVARFGGDEFVILADVREEEDARRILARVKENMAAFNRRRAFPFQVELSYGLGLYDGRGDVTPDAFLQTIDNRMYGEKRSNRRRPAAVSH